MRERAQLSRAKPKERLYMYIDNLLAIRRPGNYLKLRQLFEQ